LSVEKRAGKAGVSLFKKYGGAWVKKSNKELCEDLREAGHRLKGGHWETQERRVGRRTNGTWYYLRIRVYVPKSKRSRARRARN
jgi:hypothetical protein